MPLLPIITIITYYYVFETGQLADVHNSDSDLKSLLPEQGLRLVCSGIDVMQQTAEFPVPMSSFWKYSFLDSGVETGFIDFYLYYVFIRCP